MAVGKACAKAASTLWIAVGKYAAARIAAVLVLIRPQRPGAPAKALRTGLPSPQVHAV
jgi:hypothetical protein